MGTKLDTLGVLGHNCSLHFLHFGFVASIMQLGVREVAELLKVSGKTIYRWLKQGKLPAYQVNDQYRFNKSELLEWATSQHMQVLPNMFADTDNGDATLPTLEEAIREGGVFYRVAGTNKIAVIHSVVEIMPIPAEVDRAFLEQVMVAREAVGSTAIGNGIAIPHVRNPIVLHIPHSMITLCYLEHPVDFGALDKKPVNILFTVTSSTIRSHLHLLSRLAFALREPTFRHAIMSQPTQDLILEAARHCDELATSSGPANGGKPDTGAASERAKQ